MDFDFGPLTYLLSDVNITEIMVNAWDRVFVEDKGILSESNLKFVDKRQYEELINKIIFQFHSSAEQHQLRFDGVLPNGYRYNITLPPLSPLSATLTIRKFNNHIFTLDELAISGALSQKTARFLDSAVKARLNIVVSGGTGTGKTTILNTLAYSIPANQRIVTIEDVPELKIPIRNWVSLVTVDRPIPLSARDCLINALRMRPDRIIVGECRKDETFEMLQAMNTGHDGSMTTVHSNSTVDALTRLESLVLYSKFELPIKTLRYQMSQAIDLIVQLRRTSDGKRQIYEIIELTGMEADIITRGIIFSRDKKGDLLPTGYVPTINKKIKETNPSLPDNIYDPTLPIAGKPKL